MYRFTYENQPTLYVSCIDDVCIDDEKMKKCGFFLQIYTDVNMDQEIDNFCIHSDENFKETLFNYMNNLNCTDRQNFTNCEIQHGGDWEQFN